MSDTPKRPTRDPALIARLCERVYRRGLDRNGDAMVEKHGIEKLRRWAMIYAPTVRATLDALDEEPVTEAQVAAAFAAPQLTFRDWPDRLADLAPENMRRALQAAQEARSRG